MQSVEAERLVPVGVRVRFFKLGRNDIDLRSRLIQGNGGHHPANQKPVVVSPGDGITVTRFGGDPEIRVEEKVETRRQDPHDRQGVPVHGECPTQRIGFAAKPAVPKTMADNHLAAGCFGELFEGGETAQMGNHTKGCEEVAGG